MTKNIGRIDRAARIVAGLAILSLVFFLDGASRWWAAFGIVPLLTALAGWCPLYVPVAIDTRKGCCG